MPIPLAPQRGALKVRRDEWVETEHDQRFQTDREPERSQEGYFCEEIEFAAGQVRRPWRWDEITTSLEGQATAKGSIARGMGRNDR